MSAHSYTMEAVTTAPTRTRATALSPEERRAEIVAATLPLVLAHGAGGHHPPDRRGRRHRRGHDLPGLPRQGVACIEAVVESAFDPTPADARARRDRPRAPARGPARRRGRHPPPPGRRPLAAAHRARDAAGRETSARRTSAPRPRPRSPRCSSPTATGSGATRSTPRTLLRGLTIASTHPALILDEPLAVGRRSSRCSSTASAPGPDHGGAHDARSASSAPTSAATASRCSSSSALQFVQTMCTLFLPTLNADIIDKGVAHRRHRLHLAHRRRDARRHPRPGRVRDRRRLLRLAGRDGLRPRRARRAVPPGHRTSRPRRSASSARRR